MGTKITTLCFLLFITLSLCATNYVVTSSTDAGAGTLRQAITDANADVATPHTITFSGVSSITLAATLPTFTRSGITVDGGAGVTIIGLNATSNMVLNSAGITTTFKYITFNGAVVSTSGTGNFYNCTFTGAGAAALKVSSVVTCNNCLFYGNTNSGSGGTAINGLAGANDVTLNNCVIRDNGNATSNANGGAAIRIAGGNAASRLVMNNCLVYNNVNKSTGTSYGGGISSAGVTVINNCAIYNNQANRGGGIALQVGTTDFKSKLTMTNTTVSGNSLGSYNSSAFGGGIFIQGGTGLLTDDSSITNCTISGNSTPAIGTPVTTSAGGGIQIGGGGSSTWTPVITISNSTIYSNNVQGNPASAISGGGIDRLNGNAVINYSIVIGNNSNSTASGRNITNSASWLTSTTGRNMYEGGASWNSSVTTGNAILTESPTTILNTTLTDNGGTTALPDGSYVKTHALVAACAAINPSVAGSGLQTTDQRGIVRSTPDMGAHEYVTYRSKGSGNWGSTASWQSGDNSTWSDVTVVPSTNVAGSIAIQNGHEITVAANATSPALTVNAGGQLTLNSGASLGVTGNLAINSDADNGTGTVKDLNANGGLTVSNGTTNVQQYISSSATGVTGRNWYISSPLTAATSSTITTATGNGLVFYDGTTNWPSAGTTMEVMKGYIAKSPAQNTTINFNGGTLNTGAQSLVNLPLGFNLVGNPYISSVDFSQATKTNVTNSIWYRSKKQGSYNFHTYNVTGGISINDGTAIIPPMQSFWIKTTNATNTLGFTNAMRSHQDQSVVANRLKAPKANAQQLLRLRVSNSVNADETVIYFNPEAQNNIDEYDSQKMFNSINNVPEIFTRNANSNLVINGMNSIPFDTEIPLGFVTGESGNFSLTATEFKNFDAGTRIMLRDKNTPNLEIELSNGLNYGFSSQTTTSAADRFSLIFRAPGTTTGINTNEKMNAEVFVNAANQITIVAPEKSSYAIYNTVGTKVTEGITKSNRTIANEIMCSGVYIILISGNGQNYSTRIILNSK